MIATLEAFVARFAIDANVADAARRAVARVDAETRAETRALVRANVLGAFLDEGIPENDLAGSYGYGYDDAARARYESLLARIFGAERALARLSLVSGTHAIVTTLDACTPHAGRLLAVTGRPYDTLRNALVDAPYSLVRRGVRYDEVPLRDGRVDHGALAAACAAGVDVAFVQRSRGYASRQSLSAQACGEIARTVRAVAPNALVLVDNCYGELVDATEPTHHGVDAVMGSLIKNLGGGLAPGGGYVIGRAEIVDRVAARHYAPGLGTAVGPTLGFGRAFVQGLFLAPLVVGECLAGLDLAAALFAELGERVDPLPGGERHDIVQAIGLRSPDRLVAFAAGLQRAMPINARFVPEPGPVPGYPDPVVMSAGAFVAGATIELSCDAPLRPPYEVYLQGGATREHVLLGALFAAESLAKKAIADDRRRPIPMEKNGEVPYRRKYVRVAVEMTVNYARDGETEQKTGSSSDVGGGGIRLSTDEDLPLGAVLMLHFPLPNVDREMVAKGRIVLSFYNAEDKRFLHGIAFTQIDPRDQEEIIRYVASEVQRLTVEGERADT